MARAILTWLDDRNSSETFFAIYGARVSQSGQLAWQADGLPIETTNIGLANPQIAADGLGGAIFAWLPSLECGGIRAQRVTSQGQAMWPEPGASISGCDVISTDDGFHPFGLVSDGSGGPIATWLRSVDGIKALRLNGGGLLPTTAVGTWEPGSPLRLAAYPNPSRGPTEVELGLDAPDRVDVDVFDVRGRRVARLAAGETLVAGLHRFSWAGVDESGHPVSPGLYFARAASSGRSVVVQVVLSR
jgi:hypothetical protein